MQVSYNMAADDEAYALPLFGDGEPGWRDGFRLSGQVAEGAKLSDDLLRMCMNSVHNPVPVERKLERGSFTFAALEQTMSPCSKKDVLCQ